ncbi:MAG: hydrogenase nickel incorporation protein HypB [Bacteroidales bacterium]|nr:hydrogenase nickel incorporation protein HypB [Bacteroidales bacterium]
MCTTCGCGQTDSILISKPPKINIESLKINGDLHHAHIHNHDDHHHHHTHEHDHHHEKTVLEIEQDILNTNNLLAERNRGYFDAKNIFAVNLVSSPGSGKTSLLERTLKDLGKEINFSVIEGDQQTFNDANRIQAIQIPVVQINTGQACHLDSDMVNKAVKELKPVDNSILFIENVGNLVCPAMFDLGENKRVVIISTTEGDDKPIKYPDMFLHSHICIINKIDLLPYVQFDVEKAKEYALRVNHHLEFFELSVTSGEGMNKWYDWLRKQVKN